MSARFLVGIDPGFANLGFAVVSIDPARPEPYAADHFEVIRTGATLSSAATRDHKVRCAAVAAELLARLEPIRGELVAFCCEAPITPMARDLKTGRAHVDVRIVSGLGRVQGVVAGIAAALAVPFFEVDPQVVKRAAVGARDAGKASIKKAMADRWGIAKWPADGDHAADALAVICALAATDRDLRARLADVFGLQRGMAPPIPGRAPAAFRPTSREIVRRPAPSSKG